MHNDNYMHMHNAHAYNFLKSTQKKPCFWRPKFFGGTGIEDIMIHQYATLILLKDESTIRSVCY